MMESGQRVGDMTIAQISAVKTEPKPDRPTFSKGELAELKKLRSVYLGAKRKYAKLLHELHARIPNPSQTVAEKPKRERLFDVRFVPPTRRVVRALADSERTACELATELFTTGLFVKKPDSTDRPVFAYRQRNPNGGLAPKRVRMPNTQRTRRSRRNLAV